MSINGIRVDAARGFDVLRGRRVLRHFESYDEALAYMRAGRGCHLRYFAEKEAGKE